MLIPLKLLHDHPLQQQLYDQLRDLIVSGRLAAGVRMPSTRMLADQFAVSRITTVLVYERLIAEGYLHTVPAVGTFVARPARPVAQPHGHAAANEAGLRQPARRIGQPDPSLFPTGRWRALLRSALEHFGRQGTPHPIEGSPALRGAVARWLSASRGLAVEPEQVILTTGRRQALHIVAHLLPNRHAPVVLEDPCDEGVTRLFSAEGIRLLTVPVDEDGLCTDRLPRGPAGLLYVTPEHQDPSGAVLPPERRRALLAWADVSDALVVEEDSQSEFRYAHRVAPSLMGMAAHGRVLHIGCFANTLGPWLTLGYLVVPRDRLPAALAAKRLMDDHTPWLEEGALAELLDSGSYARHVHRLRKVYLSRRDTLIGAMRRHFGSAVRLIGTQAGLHVAWLASDFGSVDRIADLCQQCGLQAAPLAAMGAVLLGFGIPSERVIANAVGEVASRLDRAGRVEVI